MVVPALDSPGVVDLPSLDEMLGPEVLRAEYQPIVDLESGETVGFEALARWRGVDVDPEVVFALAKVEGRQAELDLACRRAALQGALDAGLGRIQTVFVNVEPSSLVFPVPPELLSLFTQASGELRIVAELTERSMLVGPAELLRSVATMRDRGWGIALDDVGSRPASLALLAFIAPDVIKLDLQLVQAWPDMEQAEIMAAVMAYAERTGAAVLGEGIENDAHLEQALALGATLGQGWLFGRAAPLVVPPRSRHRVTFTSAPAATRDAPFDLIDGSAQIRIGRKGLLSAISRHIENQGLARGAPPVVLAVVQSAEQFTPDTRRRYVQLAALCPLVVVLGVGSEADLGDGIRGGAIAADDRLRGEWTVIVVGNYYAGALIARDLGDDGLDGDRRYAFRVTHNRDLVLAAGRSLLMRVPADGIDRADVTPPHRDGSGRTELALLQPKGEP